jgi:hypothetical protein
MFAFLKSVFSESDGSGSFARVASGTALVASIAWVTHIVMKTHVIPPLTDLTIFNTSIYGINKIPTILKGSSNA